MKTVLVVVGHFLPGYKAGGPVRSIANLIEALGNDVRFLIVTRDRDIGDKTRYDCVRSGGWQPIGKASIMYLSPHCYTLAGVALEASRVSYDTFYLNSFFDIASIYILMLRRLGWHSTKPILLAPRGEFSPGALALKKVKKRVYLALCRALHLLKGVVLIASSRSEAEDIQRVFGRSTQIALALNLPSASRLAPPAPIPKESGSARIVFVSRIARKKNLDYALRLLREVQGEVQFDVYGPAEDEDYWAECRSLAGALPMNVSFRYHGPLPPARVPEVFQQAHLFLFPTRGENYGHVIVEALSTGCPVMISDQTPWRNLVERRAGWDIPLDQPESFVSALRAVVVMNSQEFACWAAGAKAMASTIMEDRSVLEANRRLFENPLFVR